MCNALCICLYNNIDQDYSEYTMCDTIVKFLPGMLVYEQFIRLILEMNPIASSLRQLLFLGVLHVQFKYSNYVCLQVPQSAAHNL